MVINNEQKNMYVKHKREAAKEQIKDSTAKISHFGYWKYLNDLEDLVIGYQALPNQDNYEKI